MESQAAGVGQATRPDHPEYSVLPRWSQLRRSPAVSLASQRVLDPLLPHSWDWAVMAVGPGDEIVLTFSTAGSERDDLALLNVSSGRLVVVPRPAAASPATGIADVVVSRRWLVWAETTSTDLFTLPWRLYSFNRRSGETAFLAASSDEFGTPAPTPTDGLHLTLDRKHVYFTAITAVRRHHLETNVVRMPADGHGRREIVARGAYGAEVTKGRVVYVKGHGGTFEDWEIHSRPLGDARADRIVAESKGVLRIGGTRARKRLVCWVADKISPYPAEARFSLRCRRADRRPRTLVYGRGYKSPHLIGIVSGDRLVFTTENAQMAFVYDYSEDRYTRLVDAVGSNRIVSGSHQLVYTPAKGVNAGRTVSVILRR